MKAVLAAILTLLPLPAYAAATLTPLTGVELLPTSGIVIIDGGNGPKFEADVSVPGQAKWSFDRPELASSGSAEVSVVGSRAEITASGDFAIGTSSIFELTVRITAARLRFTAPDFGEATTTLALKGGPINPVDTSDDVSISAAGLVQEAYESEILGGRAGGEGFPMFRFEEGGSEDENQVGTLFEVAAGDEVILELRFSLLARGGNGTATGSFSGDMYLELFALAPDAGPIADSDEDGVPDSTDNCTHVANGPENSEFGNQVDSNGDGIGDACDCDFNDDGACNLADFSIFLPSFVLGADPGGTGTDMNSDGSVNINDYNLFLPGFQAGQPGPPTPNS
jgi:hypothetical protein